jgi:hypothetical protein
MANGINGIDHSLVGVADLEAARRVYQRLGFTITPRGSHIGWGTANYCIMFPGNYVELLGIVDPGQFTAGLDEVLASRGEGLIGIALATGDSDGARTSMLGRGLEPSDLQDLVRNLELPEGTVQPRFKLVHLPAEATAGIRMFLCQHLSPEMIRRPAWLNHANGARRLASMSVVVEHPEALLPGFEILFGTGNATTTDNTLAVFTGGESILFVTPSNLEMLFPDVEMPEDLSLPHIAAMTFDVGDVDATADYLRQQGVPHTVAPDRIIRIAPEDACGALLEFAPQEPAPVWAL